MVANYIANMPAYGASGNETIAARFRRGFYGLRTEGSGPGREATAIGVGVFIGCLPFYGFHLLLCWIVGTLFRLNRLKVYLAANISNPFMAPWLLFAELQAGAWFRHGAFQPISVSAIRTAGFGALGLDLLVGSLLVGGILAVLAGGATYGTLRASAQDAPFMELVRKASDRYVSGSITAWEFARGKMRGDPIYRATLFDKLLPSAGTLIDVGCGQGLTLALLAEARHSLDRGEWPPASPRPPRFDRLIGIEIRPRVAALAGAALGGDAEVLRADARTVPSNQADAILLFDVLHLMERSQQEALLAALAAALQPGGVMLVREADASAGWRFRAVRFGNYVKALAVGQWKQTFAFRTKAEWLACFASHGLEAEVRSMGGGTPFANLLFRLSVKPGASEPIPRPARPA